MNENYGQNTCRVESRETSLAAGITRVIANAALVSAFALCSGGIALAEDSHGHHGADSSAHGDSHSAFSYNYAELRYLDTTVDEGHEDLDGDGFEMEGSVGLGDKFQAFALYKEIGLEHHIDLTEWAVGFGTHFSIVPGMDFFAELGYISEELSEPDHAPHSDDGYLLGAGVRKKLGEGGEVQFTVNHIDLSEVASTTSFELLGEIHLMPRLAVGAGVSASDKATTYFAEARYYFGAH